MSDLETTIGNRALQRLGVARVTSFDDPSKAARALRTNFATDRDELLAAHLWAFALKRTTLEADETAPAWGFQRRFKLPPDCLTVVELPDANHAIGLVDYRMSSDAAYAIEDGWLVTDLPAPLKVRYLRAVTSGFHPLFADALAWRIAINLAEELTQSAGKLQAAQMGFKDALALARQRGAIERPSEGVQDDSWVLARIEGGGGWAGAPLGSYGVNAVTTEGGDALIVE